MKKSKLIKSAYKIAVSSLRKCYKKNGIVAWTRHFNDIWARDSLFASFWALEIWDSFIVKNNLETLISCVSEEWQVCLRYWSTTFFQVLKFFGLNFWNNKSIYRQDKWNNFSQDQNSLFIILLNKYLEDTWDLEFFKTNKNIIKKIYDWNESQLKWDFIYWWNYSSWKDSLKAPWYNLINNIFYIESIKSYSSIISILKEDNSFYKDYYEFKKRRFLKLFWNKEKWYFNEWVYNDKSYDYFSMDWNIYAIFFWLTNDFKTKSILNFISEHKNNLLYPFWAKTNYPDYTFSHICRRYNLFSMHDYHNNSLHWLWIGALFGIVLYKSWKIDIAYEELEKIAKAINKYDGVYEVYEKDWKPLKRFFYKSEENFAWSSSFFILACKSLYWKNIN